MQNFILLQEIVKQVNIKDVVLMLPVAKNHAAYIASRIMDLGVLSGLTKLTLECDVKMEREDRHHIRTVVANCTALTHLELSVKMGSADIFATVMAKGIVLPLKHLLLRNTTDGLFDHAIISQQLQKLETFGFVNTTIDDEEDETQMDSVDWAFLQEMGIFPTSLLVETPFAGGTHPFHAYLDAHPGLESLTIRNLDDWQPDLGIPFGCELLSTLRIRHADTLKELDFFPHQRRWTAAYSTRTEDFAFPQLYSFRRLQYISLRMNWDDPQTGICTLAEIDQEVSFFSTFCMSPYARHRTLGDGPGVRPYFAQNTRKKW